MLSSFYKTSIRWFYIVVDNRQWSVSLVVHNEPALVKKILRILAVDQQSGNKTSFGYACFGTVYFCRDLTEKESSR